MLNHIEYYNNQKRKQCIVPRKEDLLQYLIKNNYLSEFSKEEDIEKVLNNLKISEKLNNLKNLINSKVIEKGGVPWDLEPTENHTEYVLSSDALFRFFNLYYNKIEIDNKILLLWEQILRGLLDYVTKQDPLILSLLEILSKIDKVLLIPLETLTNVADLIEELEEVKNSLNSKADKELITEELEDIKTSLDSKLNRDLVIELIGEKNDYKIAVVNLYDPDNYEENTIYFVVKGQETSGWKFGDTLPIVLGDTIITNSWKFGNSFPIIFK